MIVIYIMYAYLFAGLLFALYFVNSGSARIHHPLKGTGIGLKLLLLPASIILWPYLFKRVIRKK
jgi:hypothetical protein